MQNKQNVRFIRKNGRVIPIRGKKGGSGKAAPARKKRKSSPRSKNLTFGDRFKTGAKTGGTYGSAAGAVIGGGIGASTAGPKGAAVGALAGAIQGGVNWAILGGLGYGAFGPKKKKRK